MRTDPASPKTIDEWLAASRKADLEGRAACAEEIKRVYAAGPTLMVEDPRPHCSLRHPRARGAIAKFSPSGRFIGWYREGQTRGKPSAKMPLEQDLDALWEVHARDLRSAFPRRLTASILGQRSAAVRQREGFEPRIVSLFGELCSQHAAPRGIPKVIARQLGCSVEYVRRVIRRRELKLGTAHPNRNTT